MFVKIKKLVFLDILLHKTLVKLFTSLMPLVVQILGTCSELPPNLASQRPVSGQLGLDHPVACGPNKKYDFNIPTVEIWALTLSK